MTTLSEAAQQALAFTMRDFATMRDFEAARAVLHDDLRAALKQEEEASAWLSERKEHWRKEREKAQATKDQDPELSAALGWPGGISDPVLDRTRLLQMVAALRMASKQALEALGLAKLNGKAGLYPAETEEIADAITALRAALAQQDEPVEPVAWKQGNLVTFNEDSYPALGGLFVQFWDGEEVAARVYANDLKTLRQRCAKVNTAPPQRNPEPVEPVATLGYARKIEELIAQRDALLEACKLARSIIGHPDDAHSRLIDAAIKAAEEGK